MKNRIFYLLVAWLLCLSNVMADKIIIDDVTVAQGGTVDLPIKYEFTSSTDKVGFTFSLGLPNGISLELDGNGAPVYELGSSTSGFSIQIIGGNNFAGQGVGTKVSGTEGTLLTLHLIADSKLELGSQHVVNVTKCTFQQRVDGSTSDINLEDFTFNVTIEGTSDGRVVLSETSTTAPKSKPGANVRVQRTINKDTWSTICLPFAMNAEQMTAAFGSDVELGDFENYVVTEDEAENIAGLIVNFKTATAIEANHPYIIKVGKNVTEFTVDGVDITPDEGPCVEFDNGKTGGRRKVLGTFMGTYVTNFDFYTESESKHPLFLNGGKFYYATANTKKMKAFRAYFDFVDVLEDIDSSSSARAMISFGSNGTTGIENADFLQVKTGRVYSISGQYLGERENMERLPKGIYIIDGKKEIVK